MDPNNINILVVDDDRRTCDYIARFLSDRGWTVDTASDGPAALELAGGRDTTRSCSITPARNGRRRTLPPHPRFSPRSAACSSPDSNHRPFSRPWTPGAAGPGRSRGSRRPDSRARTTVVRDGNIVRTTRRTDDEASLHPHIRRAGGARDGVGHRRRVWRRTRSQATLPRPSRRRPAGRPLPTPMRPIQARQTGGEVLTRGPINEAFAQPVNTGSLIR